MVKRSTTQRGYGNAHQRERERWRSFVESGQTFCTEPICLMRERRIFPGDEWDLAHGDTRDTYRGPAHAKCNRTEGARRANESRRKLRRWAL